MYTVKKVPVWDEDNDPVQIGECIEASPENTLSIVRKNNELKMLLETHGWKYWDRWNIWETGPNWSFIKEVDSVKMTFRWYYHFEGEDITDWRAEMHVYYDFDPNNNLYHPVGSFEIHPIHSSDIGNLDVFERTLLEVHQTLHKLGYIKSNSQS